MIDQHPDDHEPFTSTEAADITRAPLTTLRYLRQRGTRRCSFRLGRRAAYRRTDLNAWVQTQMDSDHDQTG
jgi:hypothetical protein